MGPSTTVGQGIHGWSFVFPISLDFSKFTLPISQCPLSCHRLRRHISESRTLDLILALLSRISHSISLPVSLEYAIIVWISWCDSVTQSPALTTHVHASYRSSQYGGSTLSYQALRKNFHYRTILRKVFGYVSCFLSKGTLVTGPS